MNIQPYEVHVSDDVLDDLRDHLSRTRWPDELEDVGWDYGSSLAYVRELCEYWQDGFDWRAAGSQHQRVRPLQGRRRRAGHPFHPRERARTQTPFPWSSRTGGRARSSRCSRSFRSYPTPPITEATPLTPSTSSPRPCPGTASRTGPHSAE